MVAWREMQVEKLKKSIADYHKIQKDVLDEPGKDLFTRTEKAARNRGAMREICVSLALSSASASIPTCTR